MKRNRSLSACPTAQESVAGGVYFIFQWLLLSLILQMVNDQLSQPLTDAELNFTYYLINFLATILIYHEFLGRSARQATQHLAYFCQAVILGLAAYYACNFLTLRLIRLLVPGFTNYNDAVISAMSRSGRYLMVVSTVILVPPAEECVFRGLIFRNLYGKSRWAAYAVSILAFAAIHVWASSENTPHWSWSWRCCNTSRRDFPSPGRIPKATPFSRRLSSMPVSIWSPSAA